MEIGFGLDSGEEGVASVGAPPTEDAFSHSALLGGYSGGLETWSDFRALYAQKVSGEAIAGLSGHCATSFFSSCLGGLDKMLLRSILCGGASNEFLLGKFKEKMLLTISVIERVIHLGMPLCVLGNTRSLPHCWSCDRSWWPRCLHWHGWLSLRDSSQGDLSLGRCLRRTQLMLLFRPLLVPTLFCLEVNGSHTGVQRTSLTL